MGHHPVARNYLENPYPFRQDSTFLYYVGLSVPGAAAVVQPDGSTTLYLPVPKDGDALWHGAATSFEVQRESVGAQTVLPRGDLGPSDLHALPVTEPRANAEAASLSGRALDAGDPGSGSTTLLRAIIDQRIVRDPHEVDAMRRAAEVTRRAHSAGMRATRVGTTEDAVQAVIDGTCALYGMATAYPSIVTVRGEVLHGHAHGRRLADGDLLLVDAGAEEPGGYASDVTRTYPVSGRFNARQAAIYDLVLEAQLASIDLVRPGVRYRDVHMASARILARGLVEEGLLRGDVDGLVEQGAHAVFFPHGVGHLLGLDVHDMELYGDQVGYGGRPRAKQFGLASLRLDRDLAPGMVVTIEPGLYFVPEILADAALQAQLGDSVGWSTAQDWIGFGGIRIEDDVLTTDTDPDVLTAAIPKSRRELEQLVGSGLSPEERFGVSEA
jgi:Xaa-Pro aminopeptidase